MQHAKGKVMGMYFEILCMNRFDSDDDDGVKSSKSQSLTESRFECDGAGTPRGVC